MIAGLTAAAVVLPKAMAYATVAGLPVAIGLYTAFVPMIIYALLGTSRVLSFSSTTTLAILAGTQLGLVVPDGDPAKADRVAREIAEAFWRKRRAFLASPMEFSRVPRDSGWRASFRTATRRNWSLRSPP